MASNTIDTPFVVEPYARSMGSAILFIDAKGCWNVGQFGQPVSSYKQVTSDGKPVNDDTLELTALTVETDGVGFVIYAQSNQDLAKFSEIKLSAGYKCRQPVPCHNKSSTPLKHAIKWTSMRTAV